MVRANSLHKFEAHGEGVWCLAWVPGSSTRLLTGSVDETVKSWDVEADKTAMSHNYLGHTLGAIALAAEPSGQYAASSALDSTIRIWNLETHSTKSIIETPPTETWGIAFGPAQRGGGGGGGGDALAPMQLHRYLNSGNFYLRNNARTQKMMAQWLEVIPAHRRLPAGRPVSLRLNTWSVPQLTKPSNLNSPLKNRASTTTATTPATKNG